MLHSRCRQADPTTTRLRTLTLAALVLATPTCGVRRRWRGMDTSPVLRRLWAMITGSLLALLVSPAAAGGRDSGWAQRRLDLRRAVFGSTTLPTRSRPDGALPY